MSISLKDVQEGAFVAQVNEIYVDTLQKITPVLWCSWILMEKTSIYRWNCTPLNRTGRFGSGLCKLLLMILLVT